MALVPQIGISVPLEKAFAYTARATQFSRSVSIRVNLWPLSKGRPVAARAKTATDEHGEAQIMTDRH